MISFVLLRGFSVLLRIPYVKYIDIPVQERKTKRRAINNRLLFIGILTVNWCIRRIFKPPRRFPLFTDLNTGSNIGTFRTQGTGCGCPKKCEQLWESIARL